MSDIPNAMKPLGYFGEPHLMVTCPSFKGKGAQQGEGHLPQLLSKDVASTRQDVRSGTFVWRRGGRDLTLAWHPRCATLLFPLGSTNERRYAWDILSFLEGSCGEGSLDFLAITVQDPGYS